MKVAVFMGSNSDLNKMDSIMTIFDEFGIEYEIFVISAHRALPLLEKTIHKIENDGFELIIAGAGLSAALPGVIAGQTVLPVIGVPLECALCGKKNHEEVANGLCGIDALLSIVQMPPQIPVATVGINNSKNAAYLALEILGIKYPQIRQKLVEFRQNLLHDAEQNIKPFHH